jgi:uncharacterized coiled-coil protein SlyX
MSDGYLIDEGKDSEHELCIVLAERLEDAVALDEKLADQQDTIDDLKREIANLEDDLADREADISALMRQLGEGQPK